MPPPISAVATVSPVRSGNDANVAVRDQGRRHGPRSSGRLLLQRLSVSYPAGVIGVCQLLSLPVWQRAQRLSSPFLKNLQNRV
jgi:hypothetical protein